MKREEKHGWFCCTEDGYGTSNPNTAGGVENFIEDMLDEGYEIGDILVFAMSDRQEIKPITKPSFEFRPGVKVK